MHSLIARFDMKKYILNGRRHALSAANQRVLEILKRGNYTARKDDFVEGNYRRFQKYILPKDGAELERLGVRQVWRENAKTAREKTFFKKNNRVFIGVFANPRRVNAILKQVEA